MEEENIANKGEAEKCRDIAKTALSKGEYDKAIKFFDKSLRLHRLPGVEALRSKAEQLKSSGGSGQSAPSSSSSSSSKPSNNSNNGGDTTPKSSSSGNANNVGAAGSRPYTSEEEAMAKKVLALAKRSHYEVLGVNKDATPDQIKKAYRKAALKLHPDKNSAPSAEQAFKALSTAFDTLSDPAKRDMYDQVGHENSVNSPNGGGGGFPGGFGGGGGGMHEVSPKIFSTCSSLELQVHNLEDDSVGLEEEPEPFILAVDFLVKPDSKTMMIIAADNMHSNNKHHLSSNKSSSSYLCYSCYWSLSLRMVAAVIRPQSTIFSRRESINEN